jgi:uncharacterized protein YbcC (UPF0753/DUF2309 family)
VSDRRAPENALREEVPSGAEAAYRLHQRRRRLRLTWHERLHQGSRRGCLQAAAVTAAAAPIALLTLLARTIAPGRLGQLLGRSRDTFEKPLPGALQPTAEAAEASRVASADAPRLGFNEDEQVARVGGFLRSIGLTGHFAPLVVIIGHGSDSRNNPHLAAYDCGACSGRHGGPNARVFAALANRPTLRLRLAAQGLVIPETTHTSSVPSTTPATKAWSGTTASNCRPVITPPLPPCAGTARRRHACTPSSAAGASLRRQRGRRCSRLVNTWRIAATTSRRFGQSSGTRPSLPLSSAAAR